MLFKGKERWVTHPQQRSNAMRHRRASHVAVRGDGCLHPRSNVARPLDARKTHQVFLRGRKNDVVQRGKVPRPLGLRRAAHPRSDAASAASQSARLTAPTSPTRRTAHLQSCCPSAEHARDPRKRAMPETCNPAPKTKSLRQNSRAARTIAIKSRPAACTSGGINNFPLKRKGRPMGGLFV